MQTETATRCDGGESVTVPESKDAMRVRSEIELLDREWERLSAKLMVFGIDEHDRIPRKHVAVICECMTAMIILFLAFMWWVTRSDPILFSFMFPLQFFGNILAAFSLVYWFQVYRKAHEYNRLFVTYQVQRVWLEGKLAAHPEDASKLH